MGKMKLNGGGKSLEQKVLPTQIKQEIVEKIVVQEKVVEVPVIIEKEMPPVIEHHIKETILNTKDKKARKHSQLTKKLVKNKIEDLKLDIEKNKVLSNNLGDLINKLDNKQIEMIAKLQQEIAVLKSKKPEEKQIVIEKPVMDKKVLMIMVSLFLFNLLIILLK